MASRPIEKQPSAIAQHELGLPGQRLDILADLQTDADRRAVEEGLAKKAAERHRAAIIGRAAETLARGAEKGAIFIIAGFEVDRVEILLIRQILHRTAVVGDDDVDIVAARHQRERAEIIAPRLEPDLAIERPVAHETNGRFALQHQLPVRLENRRAKGVETPLLPQHADAAHLDEGLLPANFGVELAHEPPAIILRERKS